MSTAQKKEANHQNENEFDRLMQKEVMSKDVMLMKMENETIMAECRMRPRDMASIKRNLLELLDTFPDFADDVMYCKPVGKDEENGGRQKYASDLSIRAAEALAEAYGYNRVRADVEQMPDGNAKITATFTDFQSGRVWQDSGVVSRTYKSKKGETFAHSADRFWGVVVKAEKSKLIREAICRSVNSALKAWLKAEAESRCSKRCDDATVDKIVKAFNDSYRVPIEKLEGLIRPRSMGWTHSDLQILRGLFTAIRDGETTVAEAFGSPEEARKEHQAEAKGKLKKIMEQPKQPPYLAWDEAAFTADLAGCMTPADVSACQQEWSASLAHDPERLKQMNELCEDKRQAVKGGA